PSRRSPLRHVAVASSYACRAWPAHGRSGVTSAAPARTVSSDAVSTAVRAAVISNGAATHGGGAEGGAVMTGTVRKDAALSCRVRAQVWTASRTDRPGDGPARRYASGARTAGGAGRRRARVGESGACPRTLPQTPLPACPSPR